MKKILSLLMTLILVITVRAQEIQKEKPGKFRGRQHMENLRQLNFSEEQKARFKNMNEEYRKQWMELRKTDDITVKEWRTRMESLRTSHKKNMHDLLSDDQRMQIDKFKKERIARREQNAGERMERLKTRLELNGEQVEKIKQQHQELIEKFKILKENNAFDSFKKREQVQELLKQQHENLKSILTEDQMKKFREKKLKKYRRRIVI